MVVNHFPVCEVGLEASEAGSRKIAKKVKRVERRGLRRVYRGGWATGIRDNNFTISQMKAAFITFWNKRATAIAYPPLQWLAMVAFNKINSMFSLPFVCRHDLFVLNMACLIS